SRGVRARRTRPIRPRRRGRAARRVPASRGSLGTGALNVAPSYAGSPSEDRVIGVLGGSGVYELDGLEGARWERVASPFGEPSDAILRGRFGGAEYAFLPRHGRGHRIPPSEIDFRANIDALKRAG